MLLLLAAFVLGGYIYWVEIKGAREKQEEKVWSERLFPVKKENITKITIGDTIVLERQKDSHWQLIKPIHDEAEPASVNRLLEAIDSAKINTSLEGHFKDYGLDQPDNVLSLFSTAKNIKVFIGRSDYSGRSVYVHLQDNPKIYLTALELKLALNDDPYYWRSKTLFSLLPDQVTHLELTRPSGKVVLQKENNTWRLSEPLQDRANSANVNAILYELRYTKPLLFIDEIKKQEFGLDQPLVQLTAIAGKESETFLIGKKHGENYYAYNPARPAVVLIGQELVNKLLFSVDQLRDLVLVPLSLGEVKRVEVNGQDKHLVFSEENGIWREKEKGQVDMYPIWWRLANVRIAQFDARVDFNAPFVTWKVTTQDGKIYQYEAVKAAQGQAGCYVRELPSGRTGLLHKEDCDNLDLTLSLVQPKSKPSSAAPS